MSTKVNTEKETVKNSDIAVKWDDSKMRTTYANVANVTSTRDEITLLFGTNQSLNIAESQQIKIDLSDRIILGPFVAKRLYELLGNVVKEYESRFVSLDVNSKPKAVNN